MSQKILYLDFGEDVPYSRICFKFQISKKERYMNCGKERFSHAWIKFKKY